MALLCDTQPRITSRGLDAVVDARYGRKTLYVYRGSRWVKAGPRELARAERLSLRLPHALTMYGAA